MNTDEIREQLAETRERIRDTALVCTALGADQRERPLHSRGAVSEAVDELVHLRRRERELMTADTTEAEIIDAAEKSERQDIIRERSELIDERNDLIETLAKVRAIVAEWSTGSESREAMMRVRVAVKNEPASEPAKSHSGPCSDGRLCDRCWAVGVKEKYGRPASSEPAKPEPSERERGTLELRNTFRTHPPFVLEPRASLDGDDAGDWLAVYDRAESIFATKAAQQCLAMQQLCEERVRRAVEDGDNALRDVAKQRDAARAEYQTAHDQADRLAKEVAQGCAEVERLGARLDDHKRANASLEEGLAYQTVEAKRLAGQVDELVEALRPLADDSVGYGRGMIVRREHCEYVKELLTKIDALRVRKTKPDVKSNENGHPSDCTCSLCSFTGASGPAERAIDLAAAKTAGRCEAFHEALIEAGGRQYDAEGLREWLEGKLDEANAKGKP